MGEGEKDRPDDLSLSGLSFSASSGPLDLTASSWCLAPRPAVKPLPRDAGGKYLVEKLLGRGGMGAVYRAQHRALERPVALKVMAAGIDAAAAVRFRREMAVCAGLSHPGIVRVLEWGELTTGEPYFAMELVEGENLAERLAAQKCLALDACVDLVRQVASALAYLHAAGHVHRDVKPANLLLATDGTVKLTDFGVVKSLDHGTLTEQGTVLGTPRYLAPEVVAGSADGPARDVWSLGITAWEALAGRHPVRGTTIADLLAAILEAAIPDIRGARPDVPDNLALLVSSMLARDPQVRRPASGVIDALDELEANAHHRPGPGRARAGSGEAQGVARGVGSGEAGGARGVRAERTPARGERVRARGAGFALAGGLALVAVLALALRPAAERGDPHGPRPGSAIASGDGRGAAGAPGPGRGAANGSAHGEDASAGIPPADAPAAETAGSGPRDAGGLSAAPPDLPSAGGAVAVRPGGADAPVLPGPGARGKQLVARVMPGVDSARIKLSMPERDRVSYVVTPWRGGDELKGEIAADRWVVDVGPLQPASAYRVTLSRAGGGRFAELGFRTLSRQTANEIEAIFAGVKDPAPGRTDAFLELSQLRRALRQIKKYRYYVGHDRLARVVRAMRLPLADSLEWCASEAAATGSEALLDAVIARLPAAPDARLLAAIAGSTVEIGRPDALTWANRAVAAAREPRQLRAAHEHLARVLPRSRASAQRIAGWLEGSAAEDPRLAQRIVEGDPDFARACAERWSRSGAPPHLREAALCALVSLGGEVALDQLAGLAAAAERRIRLGAITALADRGGPLATPRLLTALERNRDDPDALWLVARMPLWDEDSRDRIAGLCERVLAGGGPAGARAAAAGVLAQTGGTRGRAALLAAVDDPHPLVRSAAAWAMGVRGDPGATAALERLAVSDRDREGVAAWALGARGDVSAAPALGALLRELSKPQDQTAESRLSAVAWSVRRLAAAARARAHPALRELLADPRLSHRVRQYIEHPSAAPDAHPTERFAFAFPFVRVVRTGVVLPAGASISVRVEGAWSTRRGERPSTDAQLSIAGQVKECSANWSRVFGDAESEVIYLPDEDKRPEMERHFADYVGLSILHLDTEVPE